MAKKLQFPAHFIWGTSTAAAQVETASEHNWKGVASRDGYTFDRTTDHEKRRKEDIRYITQFGDYYRGGVDWARLQKAPFANFELEVVKEYQEFFGELNAAGTKVMFVIHHFTNPLWFEEKNGWLNDNNIPAFVDYAKKCIQHFGKYTFMWNTINEPNVYALNGYFTGNFPPFKKNYFKADRVLKNLGRAHDIVYDILKEDDPKKQVGISLNTAWFHGLNILGKIPAKFADWWFIDHTADLFQKVDFWGMSYYAYIPFTPMMVTEIDNPGKLAKMGLPHDKMWGYRPEGFKHIMQRIYKRYKKPIIITENGICTDDSDKRISSIKDYLKICYDLIQEGLDIRGYTHWSTWDNFEWNLGPTYRFGLVRVDMKTMDRTMTKAGEYYAKVTQENAIEI